MSVTNKKEYLAKLYATQKKRDDDFAKRVARIRDRQNALLGTENPPAVNAAGDSVAVGNAPAVNIPSGVNLTTDQKSGQAVLGALQGIGKYAGKDVKTAESGGTEEKENNENIIVPAIPLSAASKAGMVSSNVSGRVIKPEAKNTIPVEKSPVSLSLESMNTVNKTAAGDAFQNAQKAKETAVLPGVTRPYTQLEQVQEKRRDALRAERDDLQKQVTELEREKRLYIANRHVGNTYRDEIKNTGDQIEESRNRIREIDEILKTPIETDIHPLAYQVARVGVGAVETAENWASSLAYTLGDALTDGAFSDKQKKVSDYLAQNPDLAEQLYTNTPSAVQMIANEAGVSADDVEMFRKTTGAEYLRKGLNSAGNVTAGMQTAGDIAETIGQMLPSILLTAGYKPANPAKPADGMAKFIASKITPAPGDVFIGASVYGGQLEALGRERGFDVSNYLNAAANGAVETAIEKAFGFSDAESFQKLFMPTGSAGKSILKGITNYIITGSGEGLEEVVNAPLSEIIDRMTGASDRTNIIGEGGIFDVAEMVKSGLSGTAVGLIMGGVGGMAAVAGSVVESGNIRRGVKELSALQTVLPEAYRVEIPDAKKVTLDEFNSLSAKFLGNLEKYKDDLSAGKIKMPVDSAVSENTPTEQVNTPTEKTGTQTEETEQNVPISEDVAKISEDVAKTEDATAISDEESIIEEDIESFDESVDEESPVAKSLRIAETDVYAAGNAMLDAFGGDVRKAVDALYAEGARLQRVGSEDAIARRNLVERVRNEILTDNETRLEGNRRELEKRFRRYGISGVVVDRSLVGSGSRGYYNPADRTIHLSSELSGAEAEVFVASHELMHSAAAADASIVNDAIAIRDKLVERGVISADRFSDDKYLAAYASLAAEHAKSASGREELRRYMDEGLTRDRAVQRIIDDYIKQEMAADLLGELSRDPEVLKKLKGQDRTLWQRIMDALRDIMERLGLKKQNLTAADQRLIDTIRGVLEDVSGEDVARSGVQKVSAEMDVRMSKGITQDDVSVLRSIGRKSVNAFTSEDIAKSEKWARIYYSDIGNKSPFFRAWFGDWRERQTESVVIANIPKYENSNESRKQNRGDITNTDTGWNVRISREGETNTISHSGENRMSEYGLSGIRELMQNAILLDTEVHEHHSNNAKNDMIAFDHKFYALGVSENGDTGLYKITVEDYFQSKKEPSNKRFHNLKYIEKIADNVGGRTSGQDRSGGSTNDISTTEYSIADLFSFVKKYDAEFQPKPSSKIRNEDGTPKVMYHGTKEQFTVFDKKKAKSSGLYGKGFYFTGSESHSGQYGDAMAVYLDIKRPLSPDTDTVTEDQIRTFLEAVAENEDYSIENYGTYDVDEILDGITSRDMFGVLQDINATAIGNFVEAVELFNEVNGTEYDGIVVPTETVAFRANQIKSATDNVGTFDSGNDDIRFSKDVDYMSAVESGDMETAQRMVDEVANDSMPKSKIRDKSGQLIPVYHGTRDMFYKFDTSVKGGVNGTAEGYGIYTSDDPEVTAAYGDRQIKMYANITKPATSTKKSITKTSLVKLIKDTCQRQAKQMVADGEYDNVREAIFDTWVSNYTYTYGSGMDAAYRETAEEILRMNDNDMDIVREIMSGMAIRDYEEAYNFYHNSLTPITGIDGFVTEWENASTGKKSNIILALDSNQLKSADAVTYDDNGNVIPLSERFKDDNADIRFSRETRLTEENEYLKRQFVKRQGNEWAKAVKPSARRKYAAKLAEELPGVSASAIDAQLSKVYKVFEQPVRGGLDTMEVRYDEALKVAHEAAAELIAGAKAANLNPLYEQYADLRKRLRETAINPGSAKTDIPDYSDWRKESVGVLRLSDKGVSVDGIWDELCGQYPEFFDGSVTDEAERIKTLADVAIKLRAVPGNPLYAIDGVSAEDADRIIMDMETSLANSILAGYDLMAEETLAAKLEAERVRGENASAKAYAESVRDAENAQRNLEAERVRSENAAKKAQAEAEGAILRYTEETKGVLEKANDALVKAQNFEKQVWAQFTREHRELQMGWKKANRAVEAAQEKVIREKKKAEDARRRQELAAVRKNFMGNLTRLYNMTVDPTKNRHVPDEIREAVASFLESFAGTRLPSGKTVDFRVLADIGEAAYADAEKEALGRIERIEGIVKRAHHSDEGGVTQAYINDLSNQVTLLAEMASEINMKSPDGVSMKPDAAVTKNIEYLRQCGRIVSMLEKYIRDMNVNFLAGKAVNANEMASSVKAALAKRNPDASEKYLSNVQYDFMTPETFLDRFGEIGRAITRAYRRAQDRQAAREQSYTDYMKTLTGGEYSTYEAGFNGKLLEIVGNDGKIMKVPKDQVMELYVLWGRPAARRHIRSGGVIFLTEKGKELASRTMVFDNNISKLFDLLTDEDKRICDGIVRFLSTRCADWGNEASLYMYGYRKFGDKNYFPMNVSKAHLPGNWDQMQDFSRLENAGFTKKLGNSAKAPLRLGGIFDTADSHVRAMAAYASYAPVNNDVTRMVDMNGMKALIENHLGKRGYAYLTDFIKAVEQNKVRTGDNIAIAKIADKMGNAYKRAAVSWNISTAMKQPISIVRALNAIDGKYILKAIGELTDGKEAKAAAGRMVDGSGVAKMKVLGFSDVGFGKSLRQGYDDDYSPLGDRQGNKTMRSLAKAYEGFSDAGMWLAGKMDEATWTRIWRACELETAEKHPGLTFAEQTKKTTERFNEVIGQTQVVDTILDNAPILRSEKAALYTAFMSEPIKSLNTIISAADAMAEHRPGAKKQFGKAVGTFVVSNLLLEPIVSIVFSMLRDEEDEEDIGGVMGKALNLWIGVPTGKDGDAWLESEDGQKRVAELMEEGVTEKAARAEAKREYVWGDAGADFISSQIFSNLTGSIPYAKDIIDTITNVVMGYDNDRIDTANLSRLVKSVKSLADAYKGRGKVKSDLNLWVTAVEDALALAGIPAKTLRRDITAVVRTIAQGVDGYAFQWEMNKLLYNINSSSARNQKGFFDIMAKAAKAGDTEAYRRMSDDLESIIKSGSVGIQRDTITSQLEKRGYEPEVGSDIWYIDLQAGFDLDTFNPNMTAEKMITEVYRTTKSDDVIPKSPSNTFTVDGEQVKISDVMEYQAFAEEIGEYSYMVLVNMASSEAYKKLTDDQKVYAIKTAYDYARKRSRKNLRAEYSFGNKLFEQLYDAGATPADAAKGILAKAGKQD